MFLKSEKIALKLNKKTATFSGRFMSNSKWLKLFKVLATHREIVRKCIITSVFDSVNPQVIDIPTAEEFDSVFYEKGIKDVLTGGPMEFKEIKWLEFPAAWDFKRNMRDELLAPLVFTQDLDAIQLLIQDIGALVAEKNEQQLIIYGYK